MSDVQAAAERLALVADKPAHLLHWGEGDRNDLKAVLSALQEALEVLGQNVWTAIEVVVTADDEAREMPGIGITDCQDNAGRPYQSSSLHSALTILRRSAEVYRALSPGGAE